MPQNVYKQMDNGDDAHTLVERMSDQLGDPESVCERNVPEFRIRSWLLNTCLKS